MIVSFSLTPMMCSRLLRPVRVTQGVAPSRRGLYHWIERQYDACLRVSMRYRWVVLAISLLVIASNVPLYRMVSKDYIPTNVDEGEFEVSVTAPEGATLRTMQSTMETVESELKQVPGVTTMLSTIGSSGMSRLSSASIYLRLIDMDQRVFSRPTVARNVGRANLAPHSPAISPSVRRCRRSGTTVEISGPAHRGPQPDLPETRAPVDIDFAITGPDLEQLAQYAEALRQRFEPSPLPGQRSSGGSGPQGPAAPPRERIPGIVDTDTTLRLNKPELLVDIDRERAASLGVDVAEIAQTLRVAIGGDDRVSRYRDPSLDDVYDVELRLVGFDRASQETFRNFTPAARNAARHRARRAAVRIRLPDSRSAIGPPRFDNVIHFHIAKKRPSHRSARSPRMAAFRANIAPGFALADRSCRAQGAAESGMPASY